MKSKVLKGFFCIICLYGLHYATKATQTEVSDLAFENIEALAAGEGSGNFMCFSSGDIDCFGRKVKEKTYFSLDAE